MTVVLYGASDDLIEVEGDCPGCDEYNDESATFIVIGPVGRTRLKLWFDGEWSVAIGPVAEGQPMLPVLVDLHDNGYSARATVQAVTELVVKEDR